MMLADLPHAALVGCRRDRGRVWKVTAIAPDTHGDVVAAEWSVHVWHRKSGLWHFRAGDALEALKAALSTGLPGSTPGRLPSRRQQQAELTATVTATAAASGKQRRLATAHNTRTIRRNLRYIRPETEGRGSAPRTCSCRQYFCQAPWQRLTGGGRYGTSPSPRPAADGPGRLGCHLRDSRSRTINVAAAGEPLTKPKNGPKSCVAENPVTYKPSRLVWKASSSTGKPLDTLTCLSTPAR